MTPPEINGFELVLPERSFSYITFAHLGAFTRICMEAQFAYRSFNDSTASRLRSNTTIYNQTLSILRFVDILHQEGTAYGFNTGTFVAMYRYFERTFRPTHQSALQGRAQSIAKFAMASDQVATFQLPRRLSHMHALLLGKGGATLADQLVEYDNKGITHAELNRRIMIELRAFCWKTIRDFEKTFKVGQQLKAIALQNNENYLALVQQYKGASRSCFLDLLVKATWKHAGGGLSEALIPIDQLTEGAVSARQAIKRAIAARRDLQITVADVVEHLDPTHRHIAAFMPLFAAATINPLSILEFRTQILVADHDDPEAYFIYWEKGRSKAELMSGPFRARGADNDDIPAAWNILRRFGDSIRTLALKQARDCLFLVRYSRQTSALPTVRQASMESAMDALVLLIQATKEPQFEILRKLHGEVRLKTVRTTALNLIALKQGHTAAQAAAKHARLSTTQIYLNNSTIKAKLNDDIEQGQLNLLSSVMSRPILVPPDALCASKMLGIDEKTATDLVNEELNLGLGISLVDDRAYVVDTPINCLRMLTWVDKIDKALGALRDR